MQEGDRYAGLGKEWEFVKDKVMLPVICNCGQEEANIFVENPNTPCITICRNCKKQVFQVTCSQCGDGFSFPENDSHINISQRWWECPHCQGRNELAPEEYLVVPNYLDSEIPESVRKLYPSIAQLFWKSSLGKVIVFALLLIIVLMLIKG